MSRTMVLSSYRVSEMLLSLKLDWIRWISERRRFTKFIEGFSMFSLIICFVFFGDFSCLTDLNFSLKDIFM